MLAGAIIATSVAGQTADTPRQLSPLEDVELRVLDGDFVPAHKIQANGQEFSVPDGCAVKISLPPFGKRAIGFRQQGEPLLDKQNKKCKQAFTLGTPAGTATANNPRVLPMGAGQQHLTQVDYYIHWADILEIPVSWVQVDATVKWYEGGLSYNETSGGQFLDGFLGLTGWFRLSRFNVGYMDSCTVSGYTGSAIHANNLFQPCSVTNPMFLTWDPAQVTVDSNGYAHAYSYSYTLGGPCRFLLHPVDGVLTRFDSY